MSQSALGNSNGLECVGANVCQCGDGSFIAILYYWESEDVHVGRVHGSLESWWSSRPSRSSAIKAHARRGLSAVIVC